MRYIRKMCLVVLAYIVLFIVMTILNTATTNNNNINTIYFYVDNKNRIIYRELYIIY